MTSSGIGASRVRKWEPQERGPDLALARGKGVRVEVTAPVCPPQDRFDHRGAVAPGPVAELLGALGVAQCIAEHPAHRPPGRPGELVASGPQHGDQVLPAGAGVGKRGQRRYSDALLAWACWASRSMLRSA